MKLSRILRVFQEEGIKGINNKIICRFYIKMYIYKTDLRFINKYSEKKLKLVSLNDEMLDIMYKKYHDELEYEKYELLKNRLNEESTDKTYVVLDSENEICGYFNIAFGEGFDRYTNYVISNENLNVYLFDDYTFIKKRGMGIHKFSIYSRCELAEKLGYKTASVMIISGNKYSEHAYTKFCFKKIKELNHYRFFKFKKNVIKLLI
ncbi:MAG: hypothetical protein Q8900_00750 [Bacillota bacterium]|nr:hypothetical protein [Bacillota bacterium]